MSEREFSKCTPAQFYALSQQHKRQQKFQLYQNAAIRAAIFEVNRDSSKRMQPYTAEDFMPSKKKVQSIEDQRAAVSVLRAAFSRR